MYRSELIFFNASDLNTFAEDLFRAEITSDSEKFVEYGKIDTAAYIEDMKKEDNKTGKISKKEVGIKVQAEERIRVREIELESDVGQAMSLEIEKKDDEKNGTRKIVRGSVQVKAPIKNPRSTSHMSGTKKNEKDRTSSRVLSKKEIAEAAEKESSSRPLIVFFVAASFAAFAYLQADLVEGIIGFNFYKMIHGDEAARSISSLPTPHRTKREDPIHESHHVEKAGKVVLSGVDVSMEVYVDGQKFDYVGSSIKVDLGREVVVMVKKTGYLPFIGKVSLTADNNSAVINVPDLERARSGLLTTSLNYTAGSKLIYEESGQIIERNLPFTDIQIPEGSYQAKIVNPILGTEKKVEFQIEENKKHFLE